MFSSPEEILAVSLIGLVISYYILYRVIKAAVHHGTSEVRELLKLQIKMKRKELEKQGYNEAEMVTGLTKD